MLLDEENNDTSHYLDQDKSSPPSSIVSERKRRAKLIRMKSVLFEDEVKIHEAAFHRIKNVLFLRDKRFSLWPLIVFISILSVIFKEVDQLHDLQIESANVWALLELISISYAFYIGAFLVERSILIVFGFIFRSNVFLTSRLYLESLKGYIVPLLTSIAFASTFKSFVNLSQDGRIFVMGFTRSFITVSIIFVFRQIINRAISLKFESQGMSDRMASILKTERIFGALCRHYSSGKSPGTRTPSPVKKTFDRSDLIRQMRRLRAAGTKIALFEGNSDSNMVDDNTDEKFSWSSDRSSESKYLDLSSMKKTISFGKKLFNHLDWEGRGHITLENMQCFFRHDPATAEESFLMFASGSFQKALTLDDLNEAKIDFTTFMESIVRIRKERLQVSTEIQSQNSVTAILTSLITVLSWVLVPFIVLSSFGVDTNTIVLTTSSMMIATSFAFGASISNMVESIYFLLITKPFKVGDRILITSPTSSSVPYIVVQIDLMVTTVRTLDYKTVLLPNYVLAASNLMNLNRFPLALSIFPFDVDMKTPTESLAQLIPRIREYLMEHKETWRPSSAEIFYDRVENQNRLTFQIWIEGYIKFQDGLLLGRAKNQLLLAIIDIMKSLNISYRLPDQPIKLDKTD